MNGKIIYIIRSKDERIMMKINKYKRLVGIIGAIILSCSIIGCQKLSYKQEEEQLMIDYMVNAVLEHDINYHGELKYVEIETEETTTWNSEEDSTTSKNEETTPSQGGSSEETTTKPPSIVVETDMNNILGIPGIDVTYVDYVITDKYPEENSFASMMAADGTNLIVLKFNVTNVTGEDIYLNMIEKNIKFKGIFNSQVKANDQTTLLPDAFNKYVGTIMSGETKELVLIYIVNEKSLTTVSTIKLEIKNGDKTDTIILKK